MDKKVTFLKNMYTNGKSSLAACSLENDAFFFIHPGVPAKAVGCLN
jgi:hypothetical protein